MATRCRRLPWKLDKHRRWRARYRDGDVDGAVVDEGVEVPEEYTFDVRNLRADEHTIVVNGTTVRTFLDLRYEIDAAFGIPPDMQRLVGQGKGYDSWYYDDKYLWDYVKPGNCIHLMAYRLTDFIVVEYNQMFPMEDWDKVKKSYEAKKRVFNPITIQEYVRVGRGVIDHHIRGRRDEYDDPSDMDDPF